MKALVNGATGATGKDLVNLLIKDNDFTNVEVFVRRNISDSSEKLNVNIIDFDKSDQWHNLVVGDVLFSCLGTTLKAAGSKEAQWKIDYQYQYDFAKAAKQNGVKNYVLISAGFASAKSPFFYAKMKGQLEEDIIKLGFEKTIIIKPPLLERKNSGRKAEVFQAKALRFLNSLGILCSQKPLSTELLAEVMIKTLKTLSTGIHTVSSQQIWEYADK